MYYELKIKVEKKNKKGELKQVTEHYITDAELFADAASSGELSGTLPSVTELSLSAREDTASPWDWAAGGCSSQAARAKTVSKERIRTHSLMCERIEKPPF
jgi:hypothetical protein